MLPPIDPAELSAFLDGELPAERAEEVRAALARDPAMRRTFERLAALDADCKTQAAAATFRPRVRLLEAGFLPGGLLAVAGVAGLLLLRLALKAPPPLFGAGLGALLLALLLGWGLRRILHATDADCNRPVPTADC